MARFFHRTITCTFKLDADAGGMDDMREGNPANYSKRSGIAGGDNMDYGEGYKGNVGDSQNVDSGSDFPRNRATNHEAGAYQAEDQGMHLLTVSNI